MFNIYNELGPQGIGQRIAYNDIPLEVGMTVTDEPGYYEDGKFGIRIENVILVRPKATKFVMFHQKIFLNALFK